MIDCRIDRLQHYPLSKSAIPLNLKEIKILNNIRLKNKFPDVKVVLTHAYSSHNEQQRVETIKGPAHSSIGNI